MKKTKAQLTPEFSHTTCFVPDSTGKSSNRQAVRVVFAVRTNGIPTPAYPTLELVAYYSEKQPKVPAALNLRSVTAFMGQHPEVFPDFTQLVIVARNVLLAFKKESEHYQASRLLVSLIEREFFQ